MKTQALNGLFFNPNAHRIGPRRSFRLSAGSSTQVLLLMLAATLPVAVVTVLTLWAIGSGATGFLSAVFWTSGFIFLALMVDSEDGHRVLFGGSGVGLMTLAWLSTSQAPEFAVAAGLVLAAWLAAPAIRCLALRAAD